MRIILASKSRPRKKMLANAGVTFETAAADINEESFKSSVFSPGELSLELARAKAAYISRKNAGTLVIGSDQVLEFNGETLSKAPNRAEAIGRLFFMRGQEHRLIASVSAYEDGKEVWNYTDTAILKMADFSTGFLDTYAEAAGNALTETVGGYEVEGLGIRLFEEIHGDFFTILGMPLLPLLGYLRKEKGFFT